MLDQLPNFHKTLQRMNAFWARDVLDRPLVQFWDLKKPLEKQIPLPVSHHASVDDRWLDVDYQVTLTAAKIQNQEFIGDSFPLALPLLGPEIFSAFYGCPLHFSDHDTSWSDPIVFDWDQADQLRLDWDGFYMQKLIALSDALLEAGKGKWLTGMTDWHVGGDALAAFRDPQNLAADLIQSPEAVKKLVDRVTEDYFAVYDFFYKKLRAAGIPLTSWTPLVADGKYYIPSNDFSIMISKAMFDEFFLEGIRRECQFLDYSIYHLDGPGALRHLDSILSIPELDALQWVPGAGNEDVRRWIWVYQKAQRAGKSIQINCYAAEVDCIIENLDPRGAYLIVMECPSREVAEGIVKKLEKWRPNH